MDQTKAHTHARTHALEPISISIYCSKDRENAEYFNTLKCMARTCESDSTPIEISVKFMYDSVNCIHRFF